MFTHCNIKQNYVDVFFVDNLPPKDVKEKFDPSLNTLESEMKTQEKFGGTNGLDSALAEECEDCPAVGSLEREDNVETTIGESHESGKSIVVLNQVPAESIDEIRISGEENSCKEIPVLIGHSELEAAHDHETHEHRFTQQVEKPYVFIIFHFLSREQCAENIKLEELLTSCPISALQILCLSRNWGIPMYEFFEERGCSFIYSVKCTVMTYTIRGKRFNLNVQPTSMYSQQYVLLYQ